MSLAKKCNRCGKLYEQYTTGKKIQYNAVRRVQTNVVGDISNYDYVLDLCESCMSAFNVFMFEGKEDGSNDQT